MRRNNLLKAAVVTTVVGAMSLGLVSCENKRGQGMVVGGLAGGALGNAMGSGRSKVFTTLAGAFIGGAIGGSIGETMDQQDRINAQSAAVSTPVGQTARWENNQTGTTYEVTPTHNYHRHGRYCREYQTTAIIGGKKQQAYGRACRQPDGSWKMVS